MRQLSSSDAVESITDAVTSVGRSVSGPVRHAAVGLAFLALAVAPAAAQSDVGGIYCGTGVDAGITILFGALAGLGLPATAFFVGRSGLSYMQAGGNPEKKNDAKQKLVMAGIGFGIIVLALLSPAIVDNVGSQMGFSFSDCVRPF